jgi:hypothetical protein
LLRAKRGGHDHGRNRGERGRESGEMNAPCDHGATSGDEVIGYAPGTFTAVASLTLSLAGVIHF